jgi:hypothetical protein
MSHDIEAQCHCIWKQYHSDGTPKPINFDHLGSEPTTLAWQLFGRNSLRPHVPPFARSPSMGPKIEIRNNTSHTCPIIFSHKLLYDHRRTITITRRDPMCFLRRFLLGDRRRNTALLIPLARNTLLPILLFLLFIVNLVFATDFFFLLDIQMLSLIAVPWRIRGRGFCTRDETCPSGGLILLETKHATFDSPLLFQNGKVCW